MAERQGKSYLSSITNIEKLKVILKAVDAEKPKTEIPDFYKKAIALKLGVPKTKIIVNISTFPKGQYELINLIEDVSGKILYSTSKTSKDVLYGLSNIIGVLMLGGINRNFVYGIILFPS